MVNEAALTARAAEVAAVVPDPELPFLTIGELGMVRGAAAKDGAIEVALSPTYIGCPATRLIAEEGREKLAAHGIVPPPLGAARAALFERPALRCPACGGTRTELLSAFGTTPCKALHRCLDCAEPFEAFKCL